jgi:hypothetical protein
MNKALAKEHMLHILTTEHSPTDALVAVESLRDYVFLALITKAFVEHTDITMEDDMVHVLTDPPPPACPSDPRGRNSPQRAPPRTGMKH